MIRLLSYNIHKGIGGYDRKYDLGRILAVLEAERPDVVCLQEVTWEAKRTHWHDQPEMLAKHLNLNGFNFQLNVRYRRGGYGNLVLSRWPFASQQQVCLRRGWWKPRGAQVVVVHTPRGPLHIANWHLGLGERERHWQAERLLKNEHFRRNDHLPTLVVGDFNDWRDTLAAGPFARHDFHHVTGPTGGYRSFPAFLPVLSLDKAFVRGHVAVKGARLVRTPLARRASDHLPLVLDLDLRK